MNLAADTRRGALAIIADKSGYCICLFMKLVMEGARPLVRSLVRQMDGKGRRYSAANGHSQSTRVVTRLA